MYMINREYFEQTYKVYNPRNTMFISRNDGMFNNAFNHARDTIVNLNTFIGMSRMNYSNKQIEKINSFKNQTI